MLIAVIISASASAIIGNDTSGNEIRYELGYITFNTTEGNTRIQSSGDYFSSLIRESDLVGWFSSLEYNFFKPATPDLHLPLNDTYTNISSNTFEWNNTTDPENLKLDYLFEIWNESSVTNIHFTNYSIAETANTTKTEATINGDGTFYWRVAANDSSKNSSFSELRVITIDTTLPAAFNLTSPTDASSSTDTTPTLQWGASTEANLDNYSIEISITADFSTINQTENSSTNSFSSWSSPLTADTYYWRVTAVDKVNNQQLSENNLSFTVTASETTTTTVTGASIESGAGGGTKPFSLNILAPEGIVLASNREISVPILVINPSTIMLRGINLEVKSDEPNIIPSFDRTYISELDARAQEKLTLIINTKDLTVGSYGITIFASIVSPSFSDTTRIFANLLEKTEGEREVLEQIEFAKKLFQGNPECLDLSEYITGAEAALQSNDAATALSLAENAVEACSKLLEQKSQFGAITTAAAFTDKVISQLKSSKNIIILSEILGLMVIVAIAVKYIRLNMKKRTKELK